ncbi:TPA: hypothetical protein U7M85_004996 [Escherichia coli]|uniref:hypothetical protein n=1 Tax=Escherichia coli TaxID=562 RepID=UPI0018A258DD|nr:hypothetical protein [Escherichia coli]MBF7899868.1 hypothetical protein [Escherichia coli]HCA5916435.1 hypothetical protein [Escherichia coli]HEN7129626.1 hypothetical protein [Escherichia coli]
MIESNKSITICCDFLMTRNKTQRYHLRWFSLLMNRVLSDVVFADINEFISDDEHNEKFQRETFFSLSGLNIPLEETHAHFNEHAITDKSVNYLGNFLKNTFVIGYELSEQTKSILDKINIKYIDIWLHPIRFLDDNFYAYYSSDKSIWNCLKKYRIDENIYYLYADKLKIQSYMGWDKFHSSIDKLLIDNSCLFVGQTLTDKAVCCDGTMLTILNFENDFTRLTKEYSHVYFSPHPMIKGDYSAQIDFLKQFNNVSIIKEPAYKLLCSDKIKKVVAISSSLVYEAQFFNKETEFFYRPIVPIYNNREGVGYLSIFNKLHSSKFWADVLSKDFIIKDNIIDVDFLVKKNNYRDMLSLYYNNKVFDKEHYIYEKTKIPVTHQTQKGKPNEKTQQVYYSNKIAIDKIKNMLSKHKVVSLDIFDTVLQRNIANPSDIPYLVAKYGKEKFFINIESYMDARKKCKSLSQYTYETPLSERYKIIGKLLSIPEDVFLDLYNYELDIERKVIDSRTIGKEIIKAARALNKKVILVSDIYYDKEFVAQLLKHCDIDYDELYISSELDKTKESGSLYDHLIDIYGCDIIHIGDNRHSDYNKALDKGLTPVLLLSNKEQIKRTINSYTELSGDFKEFRNGLIQANMSQYPMITYQPGYMRGNAEFFGYNVVGDIFLAFAHWILKEAQKRKIKKLAFLARDGEIVKKVFDLINNTDIESKYILASRRCVRVSSMYTKQDVINEIDNFISSLNNNNNDIFNYLSLRFGLSIESIKNIFEGSIPSLKNNNELKEKLYSDNFISAVLSNSAIERSNYISYLKNNHIDSNTAFIDIGHNGSLQASICKLLGLKKSTGLYFATYEGIDATLACVSGEHVGIGYYKDRISVQNKSDNYIKYALMIETIFLNEKGTFIKFNKVDDKLIPEYLSVKNEAKRISFIRSLQKGILHYISDLTKSLNSMNFDIAKNDTFSRSFDPCERFFKIMQQPVLRDAQMFSGVTMENYFSGRDIRYITPKFDMLNSVCLWREGTKLIKEHVAKDNKKNERTYAKNTVSIKTLKPRPIIGNIAKTTLTLAESFYIMMAPFVNKKKVKKLILDKEKFYNDSQNKIIKKIWHASR